MTLRHKILGMTLATAVLFGVAAKAETVVPLVTPNTTITLTNATAKTISGNVEFNEMGIQRGNGTMIPYSIPPFSEQTIPSPITDTNILNSNYATVEPTTGNAEPIVSAFDCDNGNGHNVPVWTLDKINNTQPLAGELRTGDEYILTASGNQNWNTTFDCTVRDERSTNSITSPRSSFNPQTVIIAKVGALFNLGLPANQTIEQHFQNDGSQGYSALVYTDPASLDTRISEMKKYTPVQQPADLIAKAYVQKWLPPSDTGFYLNNKEIRALINGDSHGTPSYSTQLAQILVNSSGANGQTVDQLNHWLKDQTDENLANGEIYHAYDPFLYNNASYGTVGIGFNEEPDGSWAAYPLSTTNVLPAYSLVRDQFLWRYVMDNPDQYGGNFTTGPDMNFNPTWNTQDPNQ